MNLSITGRNFSLAAELMISEVRQLTNKDQLPDGQGRTQNPRHENNTAINTLPPLLNREYSWFCRKFCQT